MHAQSSAAAHIRVLRVVAGHPRCRVAKMLLFVSLVPKNAMTLPRDGRAVHLRRVWAHPDPHQSDTPVEVQLICGKTLERNLVGTCLQLRAGAAGALQGRGCM